jgi:two-component system, sensor histidine kinase YesM
MDVFTVFITNPSLYENKYMKFLDSSHNAAYIRDDVLSTRGPDGVWKPDLTLDDNANLYLGYYRKLISGTNLLSGTQDVAVLEAKVYLSDIEFLMRNVSLPTNSLYILRSASGEDYQLDHEGRLTLIESDSHIWSAKSQVLHVSLVNGYQLIAAIPNAEISIRSLRSYAILLSVMILTVCCVLFTSTFTLKRVTKSLNDFILAIKHEDAGLLVDTYPEDDTNEISMIKKRFTKLVTTIQSLNDEKLEAFKQTKQMEIDLLQAKINPHLLYNSLSVIKWLAQRNNDTHMVDLVNSLTRYYRKVLNNGNTILEVREELSLVRELVNIMSINHASEYKLVIHVDQNLMNHRTIKMIFQPLVENAIIHGLNGKDGDRIITLTGTFCADCMQFVIEDNGHGLSRDKLMTFSPASATRTRQRMTLSCKMGLAAATITA